MPISHKISAKLRSSSWIRKMFEEGYSFIGGKSGVSTGRFCFDNGS